MTIMCCVYDFREGGEGGGGGAVLQTWLFLDYVHRLLLLQIQILIHYDQTHVQGMANTKDHAKEAFT